MRLAGAIIIFLIIFASALTAGSVRKTVVIAHRGASAYAPEHTLAAYRLAIEQGADYVEQDLQVTKDGALLCLHDPDLRRTTNVAEVFPDRATERSIEGQSKRGWYTVDFTLEEIKRLDAGSWFNRANPFAARPDYASQKIPTLEEAIKLIGDRAKLYIEIKEFEFYRSLGIDVTEKLVAVLKAHGFDRKPDRVMIQSFSKACLIHLRELAPRYARIQLLPMESRDRAKDTSAVSESLAREIAEYAQGAGPSKSMIRSAKDVAIFHRAGLIIHPYTFRGTTIATKRRPLDEKQTDGSTLRENIIADIRRFVEYGIDGGFTDYPDLWREADKQNR
ncbi:MAG TPA: glycerophosphodiester phosphodiesterase family protein [Blastocatellia bacterium]|jgi:glycerophosphoryl diester phosphodiesterase